MGGPANKRSSMRTKIKGRVQTAVSSPLPLPPHPPKHEVESPRLPPTPLRRGHLTALQTIRESPHLRSQCRVGAQTDHFRNPDRTASAGVLVQTHPAMLSSVVISKFPSIGRRNPPEKLDSRSPSMVLQTQTGRVLSLPTQVRLPLSFSSMRPPTHSSHRGSRWIWY